MEPRVDRQGFTMMELLVASVVGGLLVLVMSQSFVNSAKMMSMMKSQQQLMDFTNVLSVISSHPEKCGLMFQNLNVDLSRFPVPLSELRAPANIAVGNVDQGIKISKIEIASETTSLPQLKDADRSERKLVTIHIEGLAIANQRLIQADHKMVLIYKGSVTSATITGCYSAGAGTPAGMCQELGGTYYPTPTAGSPKCDIPAVYQ